VLACAPTQLLGSPPRFALLSLSLGPSVCPSVELHVRVDLSVAERHSCRGKASLELKVNYATSFVVSLIYEVSKSCTKSDACMIVLYIMIERHFSLVRI